MAKLRSELTLSDDELRAIGCVAVESTYFDVVLDDLIEHLCCLDEHDFRILTAGAQLAAKVEIIKGVTKSKVKSDFKMEYKKLFDDIGDAVAKRNSVIHGRWGVPRLTGGPKTAPDG